MDDMNAESAKNETATRGSTAGMRSGMPIVTVTRSITQLLWR